MRWLKDENSVTGSSSIMDTVSLRSMEMYDQIVQGKVDTNSVQSMATYRHIIPLNDKPSTPTSSTSKHYNTCLLQEVTEGEGRKKRLLSTDSGVEFICHDNMSSTSCSHDPSQSSSGGVKLSANGYVFKLTKHEDMDYILPEMANEMIATRDTTLHVGGYVRPETFGWDSNSMADKKCHHCISVKSLSSDSGHDDEVNIQSDEMPTGSHDIEQNLQFNNNGYVTSPV